MHTVFLSIVYALLCLVHLAACLMRHNAVRGITKPFLMPVLAFLYLSFDKTPQLLVFFALILGSAGDLFLLFTEKPGCMKAGMTAFALGHICYIAAFFKDINAVDPFVLAAAAVSYGIMVFILYRHFGKFLPRAMLIPATAYLLILSAMSVSALLHFASAPSLNGLSAVSGSWLFIFSDTLLTSFLFKPGTKQNNFSVMLTYIFAQTFLAAGFAQAFAR